MLLAWYPTYSLTVICMNTWMLFQNELDHYEQKILKHSHYKKEKADLEEVINIQGKHDNQIHLSKLEDVQQKEKDYAYKVSEKWLSLCFSEHVRY